MRGRTPDRLCAEAIELAREAAEDAAFPGKIGDHLGVVADGDRVVTHLFECLEPGYRGWRWAVTVARASWARTVTLDETVLLPGPDALLAPEWVPWSERLRPGDLGPGDLLPTGADDPRLEPGYMGEDEPPPNSVLAEGAREATERLAEDEDADISPVPVHPGRRPGGGPADGTAAGTEEVAAGAPTRGSIAAVAEEIGMGRPRVLSRSGLHAAADRWEEAYGPRTPMAQAAPASCVTCGFLVPMAGSLRQAFGVCANEFSPADGRVVSLAYGCGAHSEAAVMPRTPRPAPPVVDETRVDELPLHGGADGADSTDGAGGTDGTGGTDGRAEDSGAEA